VPPGYSAIEESFTAAIRQMKPRELRGLISQYPVGRYRIDFALPTIKFGIELDGFHSHSSTEDIASDRYRERQLMRAGWTIIRFGGLEVHRSVSQCVIEANELAGAHRTRCKRRRW
jgi:very-short-patch-repair endonuclease